MTTFDFDVIADRATDRLMDENPYDVVRWAVGVTAMEIAGYLQGVKDALYWEEDANYVISSYECDIRDLVKDAKKFADANR